MNDDDSRRNTNSDKPESGFSPGDPRDSAPGERREPVFTDFDEDEEYDESERDTDYASAYEDESEDEEYLEPLEDEDPDELSTEWQEPEATGATSITRAAAGNPWDVPDNTDAGDDEYEVDGSDTGSDFDDVEDQVSQEGAVAYDPEPGLLAQTDTAEQGSEDEWDDQDEYSADFEEPLEPGAHSWPLGLVIVGVVALVLLAAGGYGVIQQRSATQEEIRQLQATLATAASPADVAASREALREIEVRNKNLESATDRLTLENRRLSDTVAGLEKQLAVQQAALSRAEAPKPAPAPKPATAKPAPKPASATAGGDWFVNFSSYSQRSVAENWAKKLKPSAGKAVVAASSKDGKTFYRVRIVGLADRAAAQKVAGKLQLAYKLPPLWVGSE